MNAGNVAFKLVCIVSLAHKASIALGSLIIIESKCPFKSMLLAIKYMKVVQVSFLNRTTLSLS